MTNVSLKRGTEQLLNFELLLFNLFFSGLQKKVINCGRTTTVAKNGANVESREKNQKVKKINK